MGVDSWDDTAENVTSRISGDSISSRIDDDGASPVTPKVNAFDSDGISLDSGNIEAMLNPLTTFNIDWLPFVSSWQHSRTNAMNFLTHSEENYTILGSMMENSIPDWHDPDTCHSYPVNVKCQKLLLGSSCDCTLWYQAR